MIVLDGYDWRTRELTLQLRNGGSNTLNMVVAKYFIDEQEYSPDLQSSGFHHSNLLPDETCRVRIIADEKGKRKFKVQMGEQFFVAEITSSEKVDARPPREATKPSIIPSVPLSTRHIASVPVVSAKQRLPTRQYPRKRVFGSSGKESEKQH